MSNRITDAPILPNRCCTQPFLSVRNVDVLEGFKSIEDKSQDLIIADPPYYKAINEKHLEGNQSDQKKFIGNSVVPHVVKSWTEAMAQRIINNKKNKVA